MSAISAIRNRSVGYWRVISSLLGSQTARRLAVRRLCCPLLTAFYFSGRVLADFYASAVARVSSRTVEAYALLRACILRAAPRHPCLPLSRRIAHGQKTFHGCGMLTTR